MPSKPKFDSRQMMELAVAVMKRSVAERRDDSKTSPLVGAVLVRPDGSTETAYRGELREGDHAEYTLLERKHRSARLDGSVLFATLEPCAPAVVASSLGWDRPLAGSTREDLSESALGTFRRKLGMAFNRVRLERLLIGQGFLVRQNRELIPTRLGLLAFKAPMLNRNPKLQFVFGGARLAEGRGLGMKTLAAAPTQHGLPLPKYAFDGIYLNLTIYRHAQAAVQALGAAMLDRLSKSERSGWEWLSLRAQSTSTGYAEAMGLPYRTAMNHLRRFQQLRLLERAGSARATEYRVRKP